jgi:hypothetical protein
MTTETPSSPDFTILAAEVMDVWQNHLTALANNPTAKADMAQYLMPMQKLFADWAAMMQPVSHAAGTPPQPASPRATPAGAASDDGALRVAQLAYRVAELEKRLGKLESGTVAGSPKKPRKKSGA